MGRYDVASLKLLKETITDEICSCRGHKNDQKHLVKGSCFVMVLHLSGSSTPYCNIKDRVLFLNRVSLFEVVVAQKEGLWFGL